MTDQTWSVPRLICPLLNSDVNLVLSCHGLFCSIVDVLTLFSFYSLCLPACHVWCHEQSVTTSLVSTLTNERSIVLKLVFICLY